ncbi:hypothetical protein FRC12_007215 [Ceratobasidium sp. 428]|nr:hypothetical protein FRC12_007215 [Ceratobasidium sp. 428]
MTIRVSESKKQWTKLIENLAEGADQQSSGSKIVSHFELQEIIENQSRHRFQEHAFPHEAFMRGMAEVWECTLQNRRTHNSPHDDFSLV